MSQAVFSWAWLAGLVVISTVRKMHERRAGRRSSLRDTPPLEAVLMFVWGIAAGIVPLFYVFSDFLAFADYPFAMPLPLSLAGIGLFVGAIWLLHRSHADLGQLWKPTVEPQPEQLLVTNSVFRRIRHPMYAAHLLWGVAQLLLLPNLVAGPPGLLLILLVVAVRVPREERAMIEEFGDRYRAYKTKTGAFWPRLS
jgi:protein-S-isoprenylcysteine O-methyltransferase Ste14